MNRDALKVMGNPDCSVEQYTEEVREHSQLHPDFIFLVVADKNNEVQMSMADSLWGYHGYRVLDSFQNGKSLLERNGDFVKIVVATKTYRDGNIIITMEYTDDTTLGRFGVTVEHDGSSQYHRSYDFRTEDAAFAFGEDTMDTMIDIDPLV